MTAMLDEAADPGIAVALDVARDLAARGIPVFVARPVLDEAGRWDPTGGVGGYRVPRAWQHTTADPRNVDAWRPGDALAMVCGHGVDVVDVDPRNGGDESESQWRAAGQWPLPLGIAATPSGGRHYVVNGLQVASKDGTLPGVDVKAGKDDGTGRGFVFIAPTVKVSKATGEVAPYEWTQPPNLDELDPEDDTGHTLVAHIAATRAPSGLAAATGPDEATGPAYEAMSGPERAAVDRWLAGCLDGIRHDLAAALDWPEGHTDERKRGWQKLTADTCLRLGQLARAEWTPWTPADAARHARDVVPVAIAEAVGLAQVWAAQSGRRDPAPFPASLDGGAQVHGPAVETDDATEAQLVHNRAVADEVRRLLVQRDARARIRAMDRPPAPPFDAGTLADVLARPAGPADRVAGLIPADAGTLITAQRKTGKTTLSLNMGRCLLTGEDLLGRFPVVPLAGRVGILNFEVSGHTLARWADEAGMPTDRTFLVNLRGRRNPFADDEERAALAEALRAAEIEALLVDPFGRAYDGANQNDAGEVGAWLGKLDTFARAEVGARDLILTAHAGWNGERTRGSSALEDWADSIITLTRDPEDEGRRFLKATGRDVDVDEDELAYDLDGRTLTLTGTGSRKAKRDERKLDALAGEVLRLVTATPGLSGVGIGTALRAGGVAHQKGDELQALRVLCDRGEIEERKRPGRGGGKAYHQRSPKVPQTSPMGEPGTSPNLPLYVGEVPRDLEVANLPQCDIDPIDRPRCALCGEPLSEQRAAYGLTECVDCEQRAMA